MELSTGAELASIRGGSKLSGDIYGVVESDFKLLSIEYRGHEVGLGGTKYTMTLDNDTIVKTREDSTIGYEGYNPNSNMVLKPYSMGLKVTFFIVSFKTEIDAGAIWNNYYGE